jgi:5-methylcytosine-specific restriction endonuclease McrA
VNHQPRHVETQHFRKRIGRIKALFAPPLRQHTSASGHPSLTPLPRRPARRGSPPVQPTARHSTARFLLVLDRRRRMGAEERRRGQRRQLDARPLPRRPRLTAAMLRQVAAREWYRCAYCRCPQRVGIPMAMDHILRLAAWGSSQLEDLCLACYRCNEYKGSRARALIP